jgi:DNA-binding MarR family transcriptional regulator
MPAQDRPGFELPLLLIGAFRSLIDELHVVLAERGHEQARPIHGFALQGIGRHGATTAELGRYLGISKQAAAKTVSSLERAGYISRAPDTDDGRAVRLMRTSRGEEMLALSVEFFESYRARLDERLGAGRVAELEDGLSVIAASGDRLRGVPGWFA